MTATFTGFDTPLARLVYNEIARGETYPLMPFIEDVRVIVDIGANVGAACMYFERFYPDAQLIAVEPCAEAFDLLRANVPRAQHYRVGLYDRSQCARLYYGCQDSVTNSIFQSCSNTQEYELVTLLDAGEFFSEIGINRIDILKVDTEGAEVPILRSLKSLLDGVKVLYLEYHDERSRRNIDKLTSHSHILYSAKIESPHRGNLHYVRKDLLPVNALSTNWNIRCDEIPDSGPLE